MWCGVSALNPEGVRHECYTACRLWEWIWRSPCSSWPWPTAPGASIEQQRLTRTQFERWFANRAVGLVVMEACGSAHHWARWLNGLGIEVRLLPRGLRPRLRQAQQDRCRRCLRAARSGALRRDRARCASSRSSSRRCRPASHPLAVDGHAHLAHQRAARLLP